MCASFDINSTAYADQLVQNFIDDVCLKAFRPLMDSMLARNIVEESDLGEGYLICDPQLTKEGEDSVCAPVDNLLGRTLHGISLEA